MDSIILIGAYEYIEWTLYIGFYLIIASLIITFPLWIIGCCMTWWEHPGFPPTIMAEVNVRSKTSQFALVECGNGKWAIVTIHGWRNTGERHYIIRIWRDLTGYSYPLYDLEGSP